MEDVGKHIHHTTRGESQKAKYAAQAYKILVILVTSTSHPHLPWKVDMQIQIGHIWLE